MQLEFNLNIETVKKKTKTQKEEELRYLYSERIFNKYVGIGPIAARRGHGRRGG